MFSKFILESKNSPKHYLHLFLNNGKTGRAMWEWVEDSDEATRFDSQSDMRERLRKHHCPITAFEYHHLT